MRFVWAAAFLLRRLRAEVGVTLLVLLLVGITAFLFAAAPRLFNRAADEGLTHELDDARVIERNIQISVVGQAAQAGDPLQDLGIRAGRFRSSMPEDVQSLIRDTTLSVASIPFFVTQAPNLTYSTTFVRTRYQDGLQDAIQMVEGRMPESLRESLPAPLFGFIPEDYEPPEDLPRFEIALAQEAAQDAGIAVGDVLVAQADGNDPRLPRQFAVPLPAEFEVVGVFAVTDSDAEVWYEDPSLQVLDLAGSDDNPIAFVTGLMAAEAYTDMGRESGLPFTHDWRYFIDTDAVDSSGVEGLIAEVQRMQSRFITSSTVSSTGGDPVLRTGLPRLLRGYLAERSASEATLSVAAIGPLVLAGAAVGMVGILLVNRRRGALALARGRGASGVLLLGAQLWESVLLIGLAVIAGVALAHWLVPGRASPASIPLAMAVGVGSVLALVAATWPAARRPLRELHGDDPPVVRPSARRLVLEGTAVLLAVGGIVLLRQRGLTLEEGQVTRVDPLLAATPALAGLAVGIVAMRLYPLPIRMLGWLAARRRDLVPVLGLRSVGRHPSAASLPLLVLMLTAAFGAFASVVTTTVDRGQAVASWEDLGADYRIQGVAGGSVARLDPLSVDGVEVAAGVHVDPQATFATSTNQRSTIYFVAIDAAAYRSVTDGSPIDPRMPPAFFEADAAPAGTEESPIPAILSRRLPAGSQPTRPGDTFTVEIAGQTMTFVDVQERTEFPALPLDVAFVVAPLPQVQAAYVNRTLEPNLWLLRGSADAGPGLRAAAEDRLGFGQVTSRHERYEALRRAPLVVAVVLGFGGALAVAAAYTALTVMAALTLSAAARTRDLAFLRTLGLSARQALQLTVVEHGPPVIIALVPGVALGVAVAVLLVPSLGLSAFAGTERALALSVDWGAVAAMSGGLLVVVAVAIALSTWMSRRARAADALRMGDD